MKLLVIGGGASGMSAASKAKRLKPELEVTVIEMGNFVSYAECGIPFYLAGYFDDFSKLLHYPVKEFTEKRGIDIEANRRVKSVDTGNKRVLLETGEVLDYDYLVVATGASPNKTKYDSLKGVYSIRSLESAISLKEKMNGNRVCIVGDGVLGMELASEMAISGKEVTLISKHNRLFPKMDEKIISKLLEDFSAKINVRLNEEIRDVQSSDKGLDIILKNETINSDILIFAIGIVPNTAFLRDSGIKMDNRGLIMVDRFMKTNVDNVYAVGDCANSFDRISGKKEWHPLAQVANKMGRVAGSNIGGSPMEFKGALGTTLVKIFDYEVGFTGYSEENARKEGYAAKSVMVKAKSRAAYYPGGQDVMLKIVYDEKTLRILGAEISGKDGAAWRLNSVETAIYGGMTMEDLFFNDLGYTPPFGPVWDPIVIAGSLSMRD